jgi:Cu/Ag efflux protein CusF
VKTALIALAAALSALTPLASVAQHNHMGMTAQAAPAAPSTVKASPAATMTNGVVKKVDANRGEITIAHDDIKNLGMPKMTMTFRATDPAWAKKLKEGDQIRFAADMVKGELILVAYETVK